MKRVILIALVLGGLGVLAVILLPLLMRVPSPEEVVPVLANQELQFFRIDFERFKRTHGDKPPATVAELIADGHYLDGVVEPHYTRILRQLEYPIVTSSTVAAPSAAIAAYHVAGFGDFFLLSDGTIVERRLQGYTAASYRQAQRMQMQAIKSQQDGAANGSQPIRSETNSTSSAAGSRR